jgi:hypothetical protein
VGYGLAAAFWGQGLATELARKSVWVGFETLGLSELVCFTLPTNGRSRRVMEKSGFRYERAFEHAGLPHVLYRLRRWRTGILTDWKPTEGDRSGTPRRKVRAAPEKEGPRLVGATIGVAESTCNELTPPLGHPARCRPNLQMKVRTVSSWAGANGGEVIDRIGVLREGDPPCGVEGRASEPSFLLALHGLLRLRGFLRGVRRDRRHQPALNALDL